MKEIIILDMTEMTRQDKDRRVADSFRLEEIKVHVSLTNGIFYNGIITRVFEEFFVLIDEVHGATNVFYFQLNKPIEEFEDVLKCEKCKRLFPEKEIHAHHIIPKHFGGTDADGRIHLCYECHIGSNGIHEKLKELMVVTPKEIKRFTKEWLKNG